MLRPWQSSLTYLGASDEPSSQLVVLYDTDARLVATERDVSFAVQQAEDAHGTILITHGDVDPIGWGAEEGHLMFLALQDQNLHTDRVSTDCICDRTGPVL